MAVQTEWQAKAACRGVDPELFFPVGEVGVANEAQIAQAKAYCHSCPVASTCLDYALRGKIPQGIFGGFTAGEREKLLRRMAKVGAVTEAA